MKRAEELLSKYFEGDTSLAEERWLKEYFRTTPVLPPSWESYRTIFGFFEGEQAIVSSRLASIPIKHNFKRNVWLSTAVAAACLAFTVLFEVDKPIPTPTSGSLSEVVKVEKVTKSYRVPERKLKSSSVRVRTTTGSRIAKEPVRHQVSKPSRTRKTIEALEEVDGLERGLQNFEVIREVNHSLSPLSSLACLQDYCPKEKSNN